jgi:TM2 domain-containing membrane protein YozV
MEPSEIQGKKTAAGICAILIGSLGVHKFILGYTNAGLITILVTVLTCGAAGVVMGIIGLVEGIIYLTMTDAQFYETYIVNKKEWF